MATEKPRFTITVPEEILKRIDDTRFNERFESRTEAVLELILRGLDNPTKERLLDKFRGEGRDA